MLRVGPGKAQSHSLIPSRSEYRGIGPLEGLCLAFQSTLVPPHLWMHSVLILARPVRIRLAAEVAAAAPVEWRQPTRSVALFDRRFAEGCRSKRQRNVHA